MNHIKWLYNLWKSHKRFLLLLVLFTIMSTIVSISYPYIFRYLIDTLTKILQNPEKYPQPNMQIYKIILLILAVGFVKLIVGLYPALRAFMNLTFEHTLRSKYFSYILKKDYKFFNKFPTGDLVTRLTDDLSDFPKICWFACSGIFRAFDSFNKVLFSIIVMLLLNWKLTLITIVPLPLMILVFYFTADKLYKTFQKNQEAISFINNQLEMSFSGIRIIKAFASEKKYNRFFEIAIRNRIKTEVDVVKLRTFISMIYQYIDQFAQITVIIFGGYMVVKGSLSIGTFYAFYTYLSMLIYPLLDLPQLLVSGKQSFVNIDRLEEIKNFPVSVKTKNKYKINTIEKIEFKNVSFAYNKNNYIFNNISFTVRKGEKVLIIGPIGSGKTTILGLITGILRPNKGEIFINDIPINEIDFTDFRNKIGYVPQEPLLFSGSIKDNIAFAMDEIEERVYERIIKTVQMHTEINDFAEKDNTFVGQKGLNLSGGQKQRIAIARALIKNPQILILDDITASLDTDNEKKLWDEINKHYSNITCFIVSHRLSTINYADNIIFLGHEGLIGKGTHSLLLEKYPDYREFVSEHYLKDS